MTVLTLKISNITFPMLTNDTCKTIFWNFDFPSLVKLMLTVYLSMRVTHLSSPFVSYLPLHTVLRQNGLEDTIVTKSQITTTISCPPNAVILTPTTYMWARGAYPLSLSKNHPLRSTKQS